MQHSRRTFPEALPGSLPSSLLHTQAKHVKHPVAALRNLGLHAFFVVLDSKDTIFQHMLCTNKNITQVKSPTTSVSAVRMLKQLLLILAVLAGTQAARQLKMVGILLHDKGVNKVPQNRDFAFIDQHAANYNVGLCTGLLFPFWFWLLWALSTK